MASYNLKNIHERRLRCPNCGKVNIIWCRKSKIRPKGHIKTMHCLFCGKLENLIEE